MVQNFAQAGTEFFFYLKIPKPQYCPALGFVIGIDFPIPFYIPLDLGDPEFPVGFDGFLSVFPVVPMPESAVYKDDEFVFLKADVGFAGKWFLWGFESDASMPQSFFQEFFGFGILAPYSGHVEGTGFGCVEAVFFAELGNRCFGAYGGFDFQAVKVEVY